MHTATWGLWATWMISFPFIIHHVIRTVSGKSRFTREGALILGLTGILLLGLLVFGWAAWVPLWAAWATATPYVVVRAIPIVKKLPREIYYIFSGVMLLMLLFAARAPLHHESPINQTPSTWTLEILNRPLPEIGMAFLAWFPLLSASFIKGLEWVYGPAPTTPVPTRRVENLPRVVTYAATMGLGILLGYILTVTGWYRDV